LTARQPYLIQCLCSDIFNSAAQLKTRSITTEIVKEAAKALIEENQYFRQLWELDPKDRMKDRKRFILALSHKEAEGPDVLDLGLIQERLSSYGIEVEIDALINDLKELRDLELIDFVDEPSGSYYKLSIPLMGMWINKYYDFTVLAKLAVSETEEEYD
jgi:type I restriction enzyme M protein